MIEINISDNSFAHQSSTIPGKVSDKIKWQYDNSSTEPYKFYTNMRIFDQVDKNVKNFAWLMEPYSILPKMYDNLHKVADNFDVILTHNSEVLKKYSHANFCLGSGIWVGGEYGGGEHKLYDKTKNISMVSSNKNMCKLHEMRMILAGHINHLKLNVDIFGTIAGKWVPIIDSLADYRFSIIIENYIDDLYFTEKLLNCFATGTIPIYYGARNIGSLFNPEGIIQLEYLSQFLEFYEQVNENYYDSKLDAIQENLELCKKYNLLEDFIYDSFWNRK